MKPVGQRSVLAEIMQSCWRTPWAAQDLIRSDEDLCDATRFDRFCAMVKAGNNEQRHRPEVPSMPSGIVSGERLLHVVRLPKHRH